MSGLTQVATLVEAWRTAATTLRKFGAEEQATVLDRCADELEARLEEQGARPLTLQEAAALSGYSRDHLGRLVREGKIPNAGRLGAPRIARKHLPIKAGEVAGPRLVREIDRTQIVRSAINDGAG